MVHFSVFGSHEGRLAGRRCFYVTLFAGTELQRPAFANWLVDYRRQGGPIGWQYFFCTFFGGTSVVWPTLAEEYLALVGLLRTGELTLDDWDRHSGSNGTQAVDRCASFTFCGGLDTDEVPDEDKELDDLSVQRHAGDIPQAAVDQLLLAVGHRGVKRLSAVRHAAAIAMSSRG